MRNNLLLRENTIELEVRDATMRPRSFDATANTIEAVIATDAPVARRDARGAYSEILDIAGADLSALRGAAALNSHKQGDVGDILGSVIDAWREGTAIIARIQLSTRPELAAIIEDIRNGVINSVSVGYAVERWADGVDASGGRARTAVKWTPREVSFVPIGADKNARTRSDRTELDRQITDWARRAGVDPAAIIERATTIEQARTEIMFEMQLRSAVPISSHHNRQTLDDPINRAAAMAEALFCRVAPSHQPSAAARPYIGLTMPELARECCIRSGINVMGINSASLIERALHSTSDFSLILADTVGRTMRASYDISTSAIKQLGRETTANDFRMKHRLQLDSSGMSLEKVNELGEFVAGTMTETEETWKLGTYGRLFGISRQAIVNDDLGVFTDLTRRLGAAAANFEADYLTALIVSNPVMKDGERVFSAAHKNYIGTGSGAAPSETTLTAARLAMRRQTGPDGGLITVVPRFLVISPEMETACEKLLTQIRAITIDDVNVFSKLSLVVEPRFTSATRWYLWSDPALMDSFEYGTLAGSPGPQVESRVGFSVDGLEVKVREDFGGGWVEARGVFCNEGV